MIIKNFAQQAAHHYAFFCGYDELRFDLNSPTVGMMTTSNGIAFNRTAFDP